MNSPHNNSVIICETPSPAKNAMWSDTVTNYRKRLRSSDSPRTLLGTVYESPLNHFRRNLKTIRESNEDINDVTVVSTPPAKKRKTKLNNVGSRDTNTRQLFNLDESVVIVAHEKSKPVVELGLSDTEANDIVEVSEESRARNLANTSREKVPSLKTPRKGKSLIKRCKTPQQKRPKRSKGKEIVSKSPKNSKSTKSNVDSSTVNDENHNGQIMESKTNESVVASGADVEEIEVVWSSKSNAETQSEEDSGIGRKMSPQEPIIVDVVPSLKNLLRNPSDEWRKRSKMIKRKKTKKGMKFGESSGSSNTVGDKRNNKKREKLREGQLREIVIDGSNVAMGHSRNKTFSEKGLQIVINYFKERGHAVKVFLPQSARVRGRELIEKLHIEGTVVFTPSRKIAGRHITPYDDRYILEYATQCDGIVVSSDQYRDLWLEKPQWRNTIENRLLTPTFVGDYLMFPEDPLGRTGPKLEQFLRY